MLMVLMVPCQQPRFSSSAWTLRLISTTSAMWVSPRELNHLYMTTPTQLVQYLGGGQWVWGQHLSSITFSELAKQSWTTFEQVCPFRTASKRFDGLWWAMMALSNVTHASNCTDLFENPGDQFVTEQALSSFMLIRGHVCVKYEGPEGLDSPWFSPSQFAQPSAQCSPSTITTYPSQWHQD